MNSNDPITLTRDVEAAIIPIGTKVTLQKGEQTHITQSLGGSYTVIVNGNMFRIEGKDADALGMEAAARAFGIEPLVTRDHLRMARKKMFYSSAKAQRELGYAPRPAREAVTDAVAWFRAQGMLKS